MVGRFISTVWWLSVLCTASAVAFSIGYGLRTIDTAAPAVVLILVSAALVFAATALQNRARRVRR